jgi:hypothetical protein
MQQLWLFWLAPIVQERSLRLIYPALAKTQTQLRTQPSKLAA